MSVRRLAKPSMRSPAFAFSAMVAAVGLVLLTQATLAGTRDEPVSADLLRVGFKPVAEGDLLMERIFDIDRMDTGVGNWLGDPVFVAEEPSVSRPEGGQVTWVEDRYDNYVRLRRGEEEFVCVLGASEHCHRVASSNSR
jgi:hypothetical protein